MRNIYKNLSLLEHWYNKASSVYYSLRSPNRDASLAKLDEQLRKNLASLKLKRQGMAIDLGAGTGYGLSLMHELFPTLRIVGIDISLGMLDVARKNTAVANSELVVGDITNLPFINNTFDFGLSILCLHLIPDFKKGLSSIFELLRSDAKFYFVFFGEEEFHKELLQEYLPNIITEINPDMYQWDLRRLYTFPNKDIVRECLRSIPHVKKSSLLEVRKIYYLRTFDSFMRPLESRFGLWNSFLTKEQQTRIRHKLFYFFRRECKNEGFPATLHSLTMQGTIKNRE